MKHSVADLVRAAVGQSVERFEAHSADLHGDDPEDVHQARVATRRLRSDLKTFSPWLDEASSTELRGELKWLGSELGVVRDLDVMRDRLHGHAATLPTEQCVAAEHMIERLDADRDAARTELAAMLASSRYRDLRAELDRTVAAPPLLAGADTTPAREVVRAVEHRWRTLERAVDDLGKHPTDEELHAVRIRAKRCRYAAEACEPAFGKRSRAFARAMADVQGVLGDQHDAVVAGAWVAKTAQECSPTVAFALGMLAQVEHDAARDSRAEFPEVWKRARRKRLRKWF